MAQLEMFLFSRKNVVYWLPVAGTQRYSTFETCFNGMVKHHQLADSPASLALMK